MPPPPLTLVPIHADGARVDADLDERERRELRRKCKAATLAAIRSLGGEAARADIRERALGVGDFTARELAAPAPETASAKYARRVDYQLSWALTDLKREGLLENPRWSVWALAGVAREVPRPAAEEPIFADRLDELQRMSYREYLRTPEWSAIRAGALLRAGYRCSLDATHTEDLEVHHRAYDLRGTELESDVFVLCHACHVMHHKEFGRPGRRPRATSAVASSVAAARPEARAQAPPRSLLKRLFSS